MSMEEDCYKNVKSLTNDFSATISLTRDVPHSSIHMENVNKTIDNNSTKNAKGFSLSSDENLKDKNHSVKGIHIIDTIHQRQKIMLEFCDKIEAKFSLNDICALRNVVNRSLDRLNNSGTEILREQTHNYDINTKRWF